MNRAILLASVAALLVAGCGKDEPPPVDPPCVPACNGRSCGDDGCGGTCGACEAGAACFEGACVVAVSCSNATRDGDETDLDCGGSCGPCALGKGCGAPADCASGLCEAGLCAAPAGCSDGVRNGDETDLDCGGSCGPCALGQGCGVPADCASGACEAGVCAVAVSCSNESRDGDETDVDCGGSCPGCALGAACGEDGDCLSLWCEATVCAEPACDDGVKNGTEVGLDCGGGCPAGCPEGTACTQGPDCASGICLEAVCAAPRAESRLASGDDALASYLINLSPAAWNIFSGDHVPLGRHFDGDHVSYHTALRFTGVQVPAGATVTSARLSFHPTNEVDSTNNLWLNLYAEKAADSAPFDPANYDAGRPDQRAKTTAKIDHWLLRCNASCTENTEYDCPQRQRDCWDRTVEFTVPKDLKAMVQEVVDLPDWAPGNAVTIFLINSATDEDGANYRESRSITGFDPARGPEFSPRLVVEYALP